MGVCTCDVPYHCHDGIVNLAVELVPVVTQPLHRLVGVLAALAQQIHALLAHVLQPSQLSVNI